MKTTEDNMEVMVWLVLGKCRNIAPRHELDNYAILCAGLRTAPNTGRLFKIGSSKNGGLGA